MRYFDRFFFLLLSFELYRSMRYFNYLIVYQNILIITIIIIILHTARQRDLDGPTSTNAIVYTRHLPVRYLQNFTIIKGSIVGIFVY